MACIKYTLSVPNIRDVWNSTSEDIWQKALENHPRIH